MHMLVGIAMYMYTEWQKKRHDFKTRVLHVSFSGNMQSNIILNNDCAWKSYRGMEYNVSFAVQYTYVHVSKIRNTCVHTNGSGHCAWHLRVIL